MKIDWDELNKGIASEIEKNAGLWNAIKHPVRTVQNFVGNNMPGFSQINDLKKSFDGAMDTVKQIAPIAGIGLATAMMNKNQGQQNKGNVVANNGNAPKSLLSYDKQGVHGWNDAVVGPQSQALQAAGVKTAGVGFEPVVWAARNRIANGVLNAVTKTNPLAMELPQGAESEQARKERELELTTKYPEIAKLLENDQNKAYLRSLLQD